MPHILPNSRQGSASESGAPRSKSEGKGQDSLACTRTSSDWFRAPAPRVSIEKNLINGRQKERLASCRCDRVGADPWTSPRGDDVVSRGSTQTKKSRESDVEVIERSSPDFIHRELLTGNADDSRLEIEHISTDEQAREAGDLQLTIAALRKAALSLRSSSKSMPLERARVIAASASLLIDIAQQKLK